MSHETLEIERDNGVQVVRLNRPDRLNAYNRQMYRDLLAMYDEADADNDVRVVVVTGNGRAFCAGADLEAAGATFALDDPDHQDTGGALNLRTFECSKPVIAAINGPSVGIGATMTLPMDIRLASESLKMGFVFARRGIVSDGCASWFLPRIVGVSRALEWTMTGRVFGAQEALDAGLVRSVHAPDDLLPAALELAREIAEAAPVSVTMNKQLMWRMLGADHPVEANRVESRALTRSAAGRTRVRASSRSWRSARPGTRAGCPPTCRRSTPGGPTAPSPPCPDRRPRVTAAHLAHTALVASHSGYSGCVEPVELCERAVAGAALVRGGRARPGR